MVSVISIISVTRIIMIGWGGSWSLHETDKYLNSSTEDDIKMLRTMSLMMIAMLLLL